MIEKIFYSIGIAMTLIAFFTFTQIPKWLDFKPFNCNVCLSFWICVISFTFELEKYGQPIAIAGYAAYFALILKRLAMRI